MTPDRYARIKELFARAVELTAEQRDRFLDDQCAGDAGLRREVESLISHDDTQTIIRSATPTLREIGTEKVVPRRRKAWGGLVEGIDRLTNNLGTRGLLALGGMLSCIVLALLFFFSQRMIRSFEIEHRRQTLNEIVDGKVVALRLWLDQEKSRAESWARSRQLRESILELVQLADQNDRVSDSFRSASVHQELDREVEQLAGRDEHFAIWDRRYRLISDSITGGDRIGAPATAWGAGVLTQVFEGETKLFAFDKEHSITRFDDSTVVVPHLAIVTAVRDPSGRVIAALQIHDTKSSEKTAQIMRTTQLGQTSESYLLSRDGLMLSASRFEPQLRDAGGLPERSVRNPVGRIEIRDPGGDVTKGFKITVPVGSLPKTEMARQCTAGYDGDNLDGYRDYRGVTVIGAWRWLEDLEFGVATEQDVDEAEPMAAVLRRMATFVIGVFAFCLCVITGSFYSLDRLRRELGENGRLGPYRLEKLIGEGGMGKVYRAQHELLKRPTAIKLLKPQAMDSDSVKRFEREARLVSQLENPNTIRVFDFGVSDEGLFYLVMEYVDGLTLAELVEYEEGLPVARVVELLRQILMSLREAHTSGLVHRDLKPGNVMICQRGGVSDVVKVLDFGLAKPVQSTESQAITSTALVAGTPQYLAPERLNAGETNDPRSDLFSFGAVAFHLLTGQDAVPGQSFAEILYHLVNTPPQRPSACSDRELPHALDDLIFQCLAKDPLQRPASVQEILGVLDALETETHWTATDADLWWKSYRRLRAS